MAVVYTMKGDVNSALHYVEEALALDPNYEEADNLRNYLRRLSMLSKSFGRRWFTSTEASHVLRKARHHTLELLKRLEKVGYLVSKKTKIKSKTRIIGTPIRRIFKVSEKGRKVINLFSLLLHPLFPISYLFS